MQKTFIKVFSNVLPRVAANLIWDKINRPRIRKIRDHEREVLAQAEQSILEYEGHRIQCYLWNPGNPLALMVHGWEGQAGNFADIVEALVAKNLTVLAFDGPAHGASSNDETSVFQFCRLTASLVAEHKPRWLISHSFGSVAGSYALMFNKDIPVEACVMVTAPDRFLDHVGGVAAEVGVGRRALDHMLARARTHSPVPLEELSVQQFIQKSSVKRGLVLHDVDDRIIPYAYAQNVANGWPESRLSTITGTGHYRILRDPDVIAEIAAFLD